MSAQGLALLAIYLVLNLIAFAAFGWDKHKAIAQKWRTPEKTLLLMALCGPWGAILGMETFRHKTQKLKFKSVYVFLALHIVAIVLLFYTGYLPL